MLPLTGCRSDGDDDDDDWGLPSKPIPEWAQPAGLALALQRQNRADPDKVFEWKTKTCSLEEVFEVGKGFWGLGQMLGGFLWTSVCGPYRRSIGLYIPYFLCHSYLIPYFFSYFS